jgi:hypothetical protein
MATWWFVMVDANDASEVHGSRVEAPSYPPVRSPAGHLNPAGPADSQKSGECNPITYDNRDTGRDTRPTRSPTYMKPSEDCR